MRVNFLPWKSAYKGAIERLDTDPPADGVVVGRDAMGPTATRSFPGQQLVQAEPGVAPDGPRRPAARAKQGIETGRRPGGSVAGAFRPATGEAFPRCSEQRRGADWVDFLEHVEAWVPVVGGRVDAIRDNRPTHRTTDVRLFALAYPRWKFVFPPIDAAYLNLIAPWWKVLKSLALAGGKFETWEEVCEAVAAATASWNKHRHPVVWGRRRRHRARRQPGIAAVPSVRRLAG